MCFLLLSLCFQEKLLCFVLITTYVDNIYFEKLMVKCVCAQDVIRSGKDNSVEGWLSSQKCGANWKKHELKICALVELFHDEIILNG